MDDSTENDSETCAPPERPEAAGYPCDDWMSADAHEGFVLVGDLLDHRQTQPGALDLGGDVGLERALDDFVGEARAVVAHGQAHGADGAVLVEGRVGAQRD